MSTGISTFGSPAERDAVLNQHARARASGKGDRPRPVDKQKFDKNFAAINWKSRKSGEGDSHE